MYMYVLLTPHTPNQMCLSPIATNTAKQFVDLQTTRALTPFPMSHLGPHPPRPLPPKTLSTKAPPTYNPPT